MHGHTILQKIVISRGSIDCKGPLHTGHAVEFDIDRRTSLRIYVEIKCQLDATDDMYCRFYCLLNMFRGSLCPSSGARDYTDGRCLWYLVLWFSSCRYGVELRVMCPVCRLQPANLTHNLQIHTIPTTWKPKHQIPQAATICIILSSSWWWA